MFKLNKMYLWGAVLLLIAILIPVISITANGLTPKESCEFVNGTYVADFSFEICYNIVYPNGKIPDEISCPEGTNYVTLYTIGGEGPYLNTCGYVELNRGTLEEQKRCKFFTGSDAYLGGTVSASGLGVPSVLRLKNANGVYKLPVILSTVKRDDATGIWTAEFATIDPLTSQPLVPPGDYKGGCFGTNGTADGGGMKVTISR